MSERPNPVVIGDGREVRVLEQVVRSAPLGVRCWDAVLDRPVRDGLVVRATPTGGGPTTIAHRSSSGVFGFARLPTTREAERGPVADFPAPTPYSVEITDRRQRFVTMRVELDVPSVFPLPAPVVLFSSPERPRPEGFAAVRASLRIEDPTVPAASGLRVRPAQHALIVVTSDGLDHVGLADGNGEAVVFVPFDRFASGVAPQAQTLDATLTIRFDDALAGAAGQRPLFADIAAQPVRGFLEGPAFEPDHTFEIAYGRDVALTSPGRSELLLDPI